MRATLSSLLSLQKKIYVVPELKEVIVHPPKNFLIDMQGFTTPPPFSRKSKMADKDGRKQTLLDQISLWEQQKLFLYTFRIPNM